MTKKTKRAGKRRKESTGKKTEHQDTAQIAVLKEIVSTLLARARENKEALKYVALFLISCAAFYLVYYLLTVSGSVVMVLVRENTARILGAVLSLMGMKVMVNGAMVSINGFGLEIIDECTAVFSSIVYCSAVLAYPTTLRNKGLGIASGVPALYAINMVRLLVITFVGLSAPHLFEFVHVYLWQASFIIFIVVIFLLWLRLVAK